MSATTAELNAQGPHCLRIVVTDDDPALITAVVATLRNAGHCVFATYSGDSAGELSLVLRDIDLLITNTRIEAVTCQDLIRQVRAQKPRLAVLHLGGPIQDSEGLLGPIPSLAAPFTPEQLIAAVLAAVRPTRGAREEG